MKIDPIITMYNVELTGYEVAQLRCEFDYLTRSGISLTDNVSKFLNLIKGVRLE